jgi:hypothetical protein
VTLRPRARPCHRRSSARLRCCCSWEAQRPPTEARPTRGRRRPTWRPDYCFRCSGQRYGRHLSAAPRGTPGNPQSKFRPRRDYRFWSIAVVHRPTCLGRCRVIRADQQVVPRWGAAAAMSSLTPCILVRAGGCWKPCSREGSRRQFMRAWTAGPRPARAVARRLARQESSPRACRYALGRHARRDPHSTPSWCLPLPERSLAPNAPRGSPHRRAGRSNGSRAAPFSLVLTVGAAPVGGSALRRWCIWRRAPAGCVRRRCRRIGQARCGRRPPRALPTRGPSVADSSLTTPETTRLNRAAPLPRTQA